MKLPCGHEMAVTVGDHQHCSCIKGRESKRRCKKCNPIGKKHAPTPAGFGKI